MRVEVIPLNSIPFTRPGAGASVRRNDRAKPIPLDNAVADLAANIRQTKGLIHPVLVRRTSKGQHVLIAGKQRRLAYELLAQQEPDNPRWKTIPAHIYADSVTLAEEGVCPVLVNSHITPLSLYVALFHNRVDACIWLDDCDSIYQNMAVLGLLRSALWGQKEGRVVTYTSTQLANVPNRFVFEGQIIFCANTFPKRNEAFKAVLSRVDVFELSATNEEVLELMRTMALNGFNKLSPKRCLQVVEFIAKAGGTRQLSMRLYEPSMKKVEYALKNKVPWRELVRSQLDQIGISEGVPEPLESKGHDLSVMAQAIATHPQSVKMQEEFWCKATGKSRASFFRTKKQYEAEKKNSQ